MIEINLDDYQEEYENFLWELAAELDRLLRAHSLQGEHLVVEKGAYFSPCSFIDVMVDYASHEGFAEYGNRLPKNMDEVSDAMKKHLVGKAIATGSGLFYRARPKGVPCEYMTGAQAVAFFNRDED